MKPQNGTGGVGSEVRLILRRGRQVWGLVPSGQKFAAHYGGAGDGLHEPL